MDLLRKCSKDEVTERDIDRWELERKSKENRGYFIKSILILVVIYFLLMKGAELIYYLFS